jgi:hypothetical protein
MIRKAGLQAPFAETLWMARGAVRFRRPPNWSEVDASG